MSGDSLDLPHRDQRPLQPAESVMLTKWREPYTGTTFYRLAIKDAAIMRAKLDRADRRILDVCNRSDASIADVLLGLETLVRRIAETHNGEHDD